jgi:hypothetical protein
MILRTVKEIVSQVRQYQDKMMPEPKVQDGMFIR